MRKYQIHTKFILQYISVIVFNNNSQIRMMNEFTSMKLKTAFFKLSISDKDYLSANELHQIMNSLNGELFDNQVFEQLWDQCKLNSKGEAKAMDLIQNIILAQNILIQKQNQSQNEIRKIQGEIRSINKTSDFNQLKRLNNLLAQAKQAKISSRISLEIIRKPFIHFTSIINTKGYSIEDLKSPDHAKLQQENNTNQEQPNQEIIISTTQTLSWILMTCLMLLSFEMFISFYICNYSDILLLGIVISIFFFQFFTMKTFKILFFLVIFSLAMDLVWSILYSKRYWNHSNIGELSHSIGPYLKICVCLRTVVLFGKVILLCMLYSVLDIDQSQYQQYQIFGGEYILRNEFDASEANRNPLGYAFAKAGFQNQ